MANLLQKPASFQNGQLPQAARSYKIIQNGRSGHQFKILRQGGRAADQALEMEVSYPARSNEPPAHYHPLQTEHFTVLEGEMTMRIAGEIRTLQTGDTLMIRPNVSHSMWNDTKARTIMHWTITPALNSEQMFETLAELANSGKTDSDGRPTLIYAAMTFHRFEREFRLTRPAHFIQKAVFGFLTRLGHLLGYRLPAAALPTVT